MLPLRWNLIQLLLLLICIFKTIAETTQKPKEKKLCTDFENIKHIQMGYCDNYLVSALFKQIENLRMTNKYLMHKRKVFQETESNKCQLSSIVNTENSTFPTHKVYRSCSEAIERGEGNYLISSPDPNLKQFWVYCIKSLDNKGPWTVIQRRINDYVSFSQDWIAYENGFGDIHGSFWLGLKQIYALTSSQPYELQIDMSDSTKNYTAHYEHFGIGSNYTKYALQIIGKYTGDVGNAFYAHQGIKFSTFDQLNEELTKEKKKECIEKNKSGWWIPKNCGKCNLNGRFQKLPDQKNYGMFWGTSKKTMRLMTFTQISIREKFPLCH